MLNNPQKWRPRPNIVSHVRKGSPIRIPRVSISRRRTPPPIPRKKGKSRRRSANKVWDHREEEMNMVIAYNHIFQND